VSGVRVGHVTLIEDVGQVAVRTGVTVVVPHGGNVFVEKVVAGAHVINGFGKPAGLLQVMELGVLETPIALTNTLAVGTAFEGLVQHALAMNEQIGVSTGSVNPVVGECNDSYLNDIRRRSITPEHVLQAIAGTGENFALGTAGAGSGMTCYDWKGGIGTASRVLADSSGGYTVGALLLANFGARDDLVIGSCPIGRIMADGAAIREDPQGSCVVVLATDAPLSSRQLTRMAVRTQTGLARTGTFTAHNSGEFAIAFSTARYVPHWPGKAPTLDASEVREDGQIINDLFRATTEVTEEAVVDALFTATRVEGNLGHVREAFPVADVIDLLVTR
jgi:D-aminopeptidase